MKINSNRRSALRTVAGTALAVPVMFFGKDALAAKNEATRTQLQYQDNDKDGKRCDACLHWRPGASADALGGCAIIPGDTEISPGGYCMVFTPKP